jgi:ABC-type nitrate/sulfonate/bicarbonate transport system substrate-binding protein
MNLQFGRWVLFLPFLLLLWAVPCGAQTPKLEDIRVSFASFGVIYYPHFIAKELGFYQDEGLNIEIIAMPGGLATQALVAGDLISARLRARRSTRACAASSSKSFT